ncbi:hypothetical protein JMN32_02510 [Fulvivirga sp. 29W222]|uniref:Rho-binding antiterminator n=1 Tax=Fulvivirga marina TaxID=2494733 RepID=A0A937FVD0_9BACT|nr:hypothetical protein [Fulvivirga marina]MBL6445163.1 hypothetical protein [Fulvivirga marina]
MDSFYEFVQEKVKSRTYVKVQYFTDIHEFLTVTAVAKELKNGDGMELLVLASGEEVRFDRLVRVDKMVAPKYKDIMDFTCDC